MNTCLRQRIAVLSALLHAGQRVYLRRDGDRYCWSLYENFQCERALFLAHSDREFERLRAAVDRELGIGEKAKGVAAA